jgi:hypothetical protein
MHAHVDQDIVKLEVTPKPQHVHPKKGKKFTGEDLPIGYKDENRWNGAFIPTFIWFYGFQKDAWTVDSPTAVIAMQKIWDAVYGKAIPHKVKANGPVFEVVIIIIFQIISADNHNYNRLNNACATHGAIHSALLVLLLLACSLRPHKRCTRPTRSVRNAPKHC